MLRLGIIYAKAEKLLAVCFPPFRTMREKGGAPSVEIVFGGRKKGWATRRVVILRHSLYLCVGSWEEPHSELAVFDARLYIRVRRIDEPA